MQLTISTKTLFFGPFSFASSFFLFWGNIMKQELTITVCITITLCITDQLKNKWTAHGKNTVYILNSTHTDTSHTDTARADTTHTDTHIQTPHMQTPHIQTPHIYLIYTNYTYRHLTYRHLTNTYQQLCTPYNVIWFSGKKQLCTVFSNFQL